MAVLVTREWSATSMPTALIVGASRGIGLELARQYASAGWRVLATTRTPDRPGPLAEISGDVQVLPLEVRDASQVAALADSLSGEAVDVLIHNAGVHDRDHPRDEVMAVNAEAPIRVTEALLGAVARSEQRRIVLVSSQLGARRGRTGSLGTYGDSKAALNDTFRERAPGWGAQGITAVVMHPGWVSTDMGGPGAPVSARESAAGIRRVVAGLEPSRHGCFLTWEGREHPW